MARFNGTIALMSVVGVAIALMAARGYINSSRNTNDYAELARAAAARAAASAATDQSRQCAVQRAQLIANFSKVLAQGKAADAAESITACARVLQDSELLLLLEKAETTDYLKTLYDAKASTEDRGQSANVLASRYPEIARAHATAIAQAQRRFVAKQDADKKAADAAERRSRKRQGVSIGMTQARVLESSWGRPERINRTTSRYGVREQWVYRNGGYLYFEDGVLTTIQN